MREAEKSQAPSDTLEVASRRRCHPNTAAGARESDLVRRHPTGRAGGAPPCPADEPTFEE
ncbi:hypothetical protein GCM10009573_01240 [Agromyces bracchium]